MIRSVTDLDPAPRALVEAYLREVSAAVPSGLRAELIEDLTAHLCERLDQGADEAAVRDLLTETGPPETPDTTGRPSWPDLPGRIAATWWDPADQRLLVPRAIGVGWDVNLGAAAVRLGLIEPDAEAEPFTATPDRAFRLAAAVPVGLAAAIAAHYLVRGRRLPARLPSHWSLAGRPDRWISKRAATASDLGMAAVATALAIQATRSTESRQRRAGAVAGAAQIAAIGATTTLARSLTAPHWWLGPVMAAGVIGPAAAVLFGLARAGRAAEIRHDLGATS